MDQLNNGIGSRVRSKRQTGTNWDNCRTRFTPKDMLADDMNIYCGEVSAGALIFKSIRSNLPQTDHLRCLIPVNDRRA